MSVLEMADNLVSTGHLSKSRSVHEAFALMHKVISSGIKVFMIMSVCLCIFLPVIVSSCMSVS